MASLLATVRHRRALAAVAVAGLTIVVLTIAGVVANAGDAADQRGTFTADLADSEVALAVQPAAVGANEIHLYITDAASQLRDVTAPHLDIAIDGDHRAVNLSRVAPGHLIAVQQHLANQGTYDLTVTATVDGVEQHTTGSVEVGPPDPGLARRVVEWCSLQLSRTSR